jgi:hypothetical protein
MTDRREFFIGWAGSTPPRLRRFTLAIAAMLTLAFAALGAGLGGIADDPAKAGFAIAPGQVPFPLPESETVTGRFVATPYPMLIAPPDASHPRSRTMLVAGGGKYALPADYAHLDGRLVQASGFITARGTLAMLATDSLPDVLAEAAQPAPPIEQLGRWRLTGEICDGKCASGAMRPGIGLAHRACAVVCIAGDIPPVFVSTAPVAGHAFLLVKGPDGGRMPPSLHDHVGLRIRLDGEVERRGDILVFRADPASLGLPSLRLP